VPLPTPHRYPQFPPYQQYTQPISNSAYEAIGPRRSSSQPAASSPWSLAARYGHAVMISGIRSLSSSHEQIVIGWTGDIAPPPSSASASTSSVVTAGADKVPAYAISQADKAAFQDALDAYKIDPEDDRGEKRAKYLPVWLDDKVAHGHYDGYCKQSEIRPLLSLSFLLLLIRVLGK
jgi:trehalose 6-phosphate synthase/phosphatase